MTSFLVDLRYAVRSLRNSPTFSLVAIITLALGIGVSTAGFSLADWLLLRPVPGVLEPDRVAVVWNASRSRIGMSPRWFSYAQYDEVRETLTALSGFTGYQRGNVSLAAAGAYPRRLDAQFVMPGYFSVLGVQPAVGRGFVPDDDAPPNGQDVAIISDRLWTGVFGRDPAVPGKSVTISGRPFTVVGVAPLGFQGTDRLGQVDVWLPGSTQEARRGGYYEFLARLAPEATFGQAETQLRIAMRSVQDTTRSPQGGEFGPFVFRGLGSMALQRSSLAAVMRLVLAVCLAVLLVACANAANLMLFRGLVRQPSVALHRVLGASALDVGRRSLAESVVLGLPATILGVLFSDWFLRAFQGVNLTRGIALPGAVGLSWPVLVFACGAGLTGMLLAGAVSAVMAARTDAREAISGTSRSLAAGGLKVRRAFGVIQLALSMALLVGALLMVRSLRQLNAVDLGFNPGAVTMVQANPAESGVAGARVEDFYRRLLARANAAPGLGVATLAQQIPFQGMNTIFSVDLPGAAEGTEGVHVRYSAVSPQYFEVLGIPLLAGRSFTDAEMFPGEDGARKVILSATAARRLFGDRPAVGQRLVINREGVKSDVVGVVGDSKWQGIVETGRQGLMSADPGMMLYAPFNDGFRGSAALAVRSNLPVATVGVEVRRIAREVDPAVPVYGITTLPALIEQYLADRILFQKLLSALGALAVALAAVGLYGLIAFGVATRTRELGIRIALGARQRNVAEAVLGEALLVVSMGLGAGILGGWGVGRLVQNKLYGLAPMDLASYGLAAMVLVSACLVAVMVPARAATRVDPMVALRAE